MSLQGAACGEPNVVFVITDDQGYGELCRGGERGAYFVYARAVRR